MVSSWAMATPRRCTSLGPRWRSTAAASFSPRDMSRMAAWFSLLMWGGPAGPSSLRLRSLTAGHPLLDDLGHATGVIRDQALDVIDLLLIGLGRGQQHAPGLTQAGGLFGEQLPGQFLRRRRQPLQPGIFPQRLTEAAHHRPQHPQHQHPEGARKSVVSGEADAG